MMFYRTKAGLSVWAQLIGIVVFALIPATLVAAADSPYLYGIHWWGYTPGQPVDAGACQLLDCNTHAGWDVETVLTNGPSWWGPAHFAGLYTNLYGSKNTTIITRLDYDWGQTVPYDRPSWPSEVVSAVNILRHGCHIWILGNEPNLTIEGNSWPAQRITPTAYAQIYRDVRNAVHTSAYNSPAGPHIVLIAAPSPGGPVTFPGGERWIDGNDWLGQVIDNIPNDEIDGFAIHAYGGGGAVNDFHQSYVEQLQLIDSKNCRNKPAYITEWNMVSNETTMAQFTRDCFADLNTWNSNPDNHNIRCLCWFVYDSDQQAGGGWDNYSIEYYRDHGDQTYPDPRDLYRAFEETVDLRYPAGVSGTPNLGTIARWPESFSPATIERHSPDNDTFTVRNAGNGTMSYTITDAANWLAAAPDSGTGSGETDTIMLLYNTDQLAAGSYNATVTISSNEADNSPQTISINLTVDPSPYALADFDEDGDVDQQDFGRFQACYTGPGVAQNAHNCFNAKLDGDDDVDIGDFGVFQRCMTGEDRPADPNCAD